VRKTSRLLKNSERTHLVSNNRIRVVQRLNQSCVLAVILESMLLATPLEKPFSAAC
jgi:flagellar biogenesis protein FliO